MFLHTGKTMLENLFKLKENNTSVKTEVIAGITTFMTMAYILAVNPSVLSAAGMDPTAVLLATCIASFIGTLCMGLTANLPFVLSAGMGLNAYLALIKLGDGTMYNILYKLLDKGYISSYDKIIGKKIRVYYHLKPEGKIYLDQLIQEFHDFVLVVEKIISHKKESSDV